MVEAGVDTAAEVSIATAIADEALREQAYEALRQAPGNVVGDLSGPGGLTGLASEIRRVQPDILMLGIAGQPAECAEAVRQMRAAAPVRVIAVSRGADPAAILEAMRAGASDFLYPPFDGAFTEALLRVAGECAGKAAPNRPAGLVCAFVSAKGGCGATTLACHAAGFLQGKSGKRVLLADLDPCAANASLLMRAAPRYTIVDVLQKLPRLDLTLWKAMATANPEGVDLIGATPEPVDFTPHLPSLTGIIRFWRSQYDVTIADFGHGLTPTTCALLPIIDHLVLVTTGEVPALRLAKHTIRALADRNFGPNRLRLVLNRLERRAAIGVPELERIMDFPIFAAIPNHYAALAEAYAEPRLVAPDSPLGTPIAAMAAKLAGLPQEVTSKARRLSLFGSGNLTRTRRRE